MTLPRRPRASVAGYGGREPGQNTAPSPAFSYGGEQGGARDPIYDGVGPRTSADGSSKLSLNHSQGGNKFVLEAQILCNSLFHNKFLGYLHPNSNLYQTINKVVSYEILLFHFI